MVGLSPKDEMEIILGHLNADPFILRRSSLQDLDAGERLKHWVKAWQDSGPNMGRFIRENAELWAALQSYGRDYPPHVFAPPDGDGVVIAWRLPAVISRPCNIAAERAGAAQLVNNGARLTPAGVARIRRAANRLLAASRVKSTPSPEALFLFLSFLYNPLRKRLGGPCKRCGHYFLRRTERNPKVYCSRLCGWRATGAAAIKQQRQAEHTDKLRRAAERIRRWEESPRGDWKKSVSERGDISVQFLTRAVNNRELKPPKKREKR